MMMMAKMGKADRLIDKALRPGSGYHKPMARASPAFFASYYLGLDAPPHQIAWYDNLHKTRHLQLAPRDHGKSIVYTRVSPLHHALFKKDYRILIISKTITLSQRFLNVIVADMNRPEIQKDFRRELESLVVRNSTLMVNRSDDSIKEPTISAAGVGGAITSGHFDLIILDDILDDANTKTQYMRDEIHRWLMGTVAGLIPPDGKQHVVATRKHPLDEYQWMIDSPSWDVTIDKAIMQMPEDYEYVYEERPAGRVVVDAIVRSASEVLWDDPRNRFSWPINRLITKKHEMGGYFDREYQNDASVLEGHLLKTKWLHFYTTKPELARGDVVLRPKAIRERVQGWDFAISEKDRADYTVCCSLDIAHDNRVYARFWRDRIDYPTAIAMIKKKYMEEKPRTVAMEINQFQKGYMQAVQRDMIIPCVGITRTADKVIRISALSPYFENGTIYVDIEDADFFNEYSLFPGSAHDDMLDALEIAMQIITSRSQRSVPKH